MVFTCCRVAEIEELGPLPIIDFKVVSRAVEIVVVLCTKVGGSVILNDVVFSSRLVLGRVEESVVLIDVELSSRLVLETVDILTEA